MALQKGSTLGSYEIDSSLGAGGMGEVYRARDSKLGREVALKLLLEEVSGDPDRLARFEREARVLASLNHNNIATLFGFESDGDTRFLVMELVEGETLAERIARGPMPLDEALEVFLGIAEGVEAAHEKDVIHRDLKPANIKITPEGIVKVLDFGLAKALLPEVKEASDTSQSVSPTLTLAATRRGEIMGTAAYMSPEQAKGQGVDRRSDVWAFGACLFEALSGTRPFQGRDATEVMAAVLLSEPPWEALPDQTPPALRKLLRRCLTRERRQRLRDVGDARIELQELRDLPPSERGTAERVAAAVPPGGLEEGQSERGRNNLFWLGVGLALLGIAAIVGLSLWAMRPETTGPVVRAMVTGANDSPIKVEPFVGLLALSPDGQTVAYTAQEGIYVRSLATLETRLLTDGGRSPFFSPDGQWLGYIDDENQMSKIQVRGGPNIKLGGAGVVLSAAWAPDDRIYYVQGNNEIDLHRIPAEGGEPERIDVAAPEGLVDMRWPELLPGGTTILVTLHATAVARGPAQVAALDLSTGKLKDLLPVAGRAIFVQKPRAFSWSSSSRSGYLVWGVDGSLMAAPFDPKSLEFLGPAVPVAVGVGTKQLSGGADFSIANNGTLVYATGTANFLKTTRLMWRDRKGRDTYVPIETGNWAESRISPDGKKVALGNTGVGSAGIWIWDFELESLTRLTFESGTTNTPVWAPDGETLFYAANRLGSWDLYRRSVSGAGSEQPVLQLPDNSFPVSVTPDGTGLVFTGILSRDVGMVDLTNGEVSELLASPASESAAMISPSGRWVAYQSDETGSAEVFVRPFPDVDGGRWQISQGLGMAPAWGPDDSEIVYFEGKTEAWAVVSVAVDTRDGFRVGTRRTLFTVDKSSILPPGGVGFTRSVDLHPDGERVLLMEIVDDEQRESTEVILVQNFVAELERLAPVKD